MREQLPDIFRPDLTKLALTVVVAIIAHVFITYEQVTTAARGGLVEVKSFWLTNFLNSLPYLETENTVLKFLTFFVFAYVAVWAFGKIFHVLDVLQIETVKKLRRRA